MLPHHCCSFQGCWDHEYLQRLSALSRAPLLLGELAYKKYPSACLAEFGLARCMPIHIKQDLRILMLKHYTQVRKSSSNTFRLRRASGCGQLTMVRAAGPNSCDMLLRLCEEISACGGNRHDMRRYHRTWTRLTILTCPSPKCRLQRNALH